MAKSYTSTGAQMPDAYHWETRIRVFTETLFAVASCCVGAEPVPITGKAVCSRYTPWSTR